MSHLREHALWLVSTGAAVFPCHYILPSGGCSCGNIACGSPGKHPALTNGHNGASRDPEVVEEWWDRPWNIGLPTGVINGLVVLDLDIHRVAGGTDVWDALVSEHGELPESVTVRTGSGGLHLYFRHPGGKVPCSAGQICPGVDVRGDGGYVIAPPSNHTSGGEYAWHLHPEDTELTDLPAWLIDITQARTPHQRGAMVPLSAIDLSPYTNALAYARSALLGERRRFEQAIPGTRNQRLLVCGLKLGTFVAHKLLTVGEIESEFLAAAVMGEPMPDRELLRTLNNGLRYGMTSPRDLSFLVPDLERVNISATAPPPAGGTRNTEPPSPYGLLADLTEWVASQSTRPMQSACLISALTIMASSLGRRFAGPTRSRANLYLVLLAPTGYGKNDPRVAVKTALDAAGMHQVIAGADIASGQALYSRLATNPNSVFLFDEIGVLLKRFAHSSSGGSGVTRSLLQLFSSAGEVYSGTDYANQKERPRTPVHYPCINLRGDSTAQEFFGALDSTAIGSGFLNRILFLEHTGPRPAMRWDIRPEGPPQSYLDWVECLADSYGRTRLELSDHDPDPIMAQWGDCGDAIAAVEAFETARLEMYLNGPADGLYSRYFEHVMKIALVLAVQDEPMRPVIGVRQIEWAESFVRVCLAGSVEAAYDRIANSQFHKLQQSIYRAIVEYGPEGLTLSEIGKIPEVRAVEVRIRDAAITALVDSDDIQEVMPGTSRRGRPSKRFVASKYLTYHQQ